jgi:1-acyl-sn-glycerol-3-phosphate acyltransferase
MNGERVKPFYGFCRRALYVLLRLFCRFRARGVERVPCSGACILAANHASSLDPPVLGAAVTHRMVHYMARDSLFKPPILSWVLPNLGVVPLNRDRGDIAALRRALQILKEGGVLGLFPEGTRTTTGQMQEAKGGVGFLVAKAGAPVIPARIRGTYEAWPKGRRFRPHRVSIAYGPPITPEEIAAFGTGADAYARIAAHIMERIAAIDAA